MQTFCAVGDAELIKAISQARKRVVYVAPGISGKVAEALRKRFAEVETIDVTAILDPAEDVCRIGYGDQKGLEILQSLVVSKHLAIRKQEGLRIGVLIADDTVLIWSPTPQSVEAAPTSSSQPNGLLLGSNPTESLIKAVAPEGSDTVPSAGEIGKSAVTPAEVKETIKALEANPIIPVALSQVTRVFSSKLQFVEFEVKHAKLSKTALTIPKDLLNADVTGQLRELLDARLRAFAEMRGHTVDVPAYTSNGDASFGADGKPLTEPASEASLEQARRDLDRRFLYIIRDHGTLIAKDQKQIFDKCVKAYKTRLNAHAEGVRKAVAEQTEQILKDAVALVVSRAKHAAGGERKIDAAELRKVLEKAIKRVAAAAPTISIRYKDVTFEHTKDQEFRERVRKALPAEVRKRLGDWDVHFQAAKEQTTSKPG